VVTGVLLAILLHRYGPTVLWTSNIPASQTLTQNHPLGFAYAVEFGVSNAFSWWPVMGGLTRLVKRRRHVLGPVIVGGGVLGAAFISAVGAISAARVGSTDPTHWMLAIGGARLGTAMLAFFLITGIVTMVLLVYLAAVASQQLRRLSRLPWDLLLLLILVPGIYFAFRTAWVLQVVMTWLSYNGVMFEGIIGILIVDYLILRRQALDARHLFTRSPAGKYWYWGGVNWVAVGVVVASVPIYLAFYNPMTYRVAPAFRYLGAALPTMLLAALIYLGLTFLLVRPAGKGAYDAQRGAGSPSDTGSSDANIEVTL
jgi:NCS1 family nucleobase:cation symporter-1